MKMVIVIRKDLKMRRGKECAMAGHAAIAAYVTSSKSNIKEWENTGSTKICVTVSSEEELLSIYKKAEDENLNCALIQDAGRTEFNGQPTYTVVAIGPDKEDIINKITGTLSLY